MPYSSILALRILLLRKLRPRAHSTFQHLATLLQEWKATPGWLEGQEETVALLREKLELEIFPEEEILEVKSLHQEQHKLSIAQYLRSPSFLTRFWLHSAQMHLQNTLSRWRLEREWINQVMKWAPASEWFISWLQCLPIPAFPMLSRPSMVSVKGCSLSCVPPG